MPIEDVRDAALIARPEPGTFLLPARDQDVSGTPLRLQTAIFAGGCFWGVQDVFQHVDGVTATLAGYDGGDAATASYEQVSGGDTGHAESVEVVYDPSRVTYGRLFRIFFSAALDPTEVNRQDPDHGRQYRSVLFTRTPEQARVARSYIAELDARMVYARPIAAAVVPDHGFHAAEAYHQSFLARSPDNPYIVVYDQPKLRTLRALLPAEWREQPVLTLASDTPRS